MHPINNLNAKFVNDPFFFIELNCDWRHYIFKETDFFGKCVSIPISLTTPSKTYLPIWQLKKQTIFLSQLDFKDWNGLLVSVSSEDLDYGWELTEKPTILGFNRFKGRHYTHPTPSVILHRVTSTNCFLSQSVNAFTTTLFSWPFAQRTWEFNLLSQARWKSVNISNAHVRPRHWVKERKRIYASMAVYALMTSSNVMPHCYD